MDFFVLVLSEDPFFVSDDPLPLVDALEVIRKIGESVPFLLLPAGDSLPSLLSDGVGLLSSGLANRSD